jgi:hypothetical protein
MKDHAVDLLKSLAVIAVLILGGIYTSVGFAPEIKVMSQFFR